MRASFQFIPPNTNIQFIRRRLLFFMFSAILVSGSILLFAFKGLNYGIDFTGGILMEVKTQGNANISEMRATLAPLNIGAVELQTFGAPDEVLIRVQGLEGDEKAQIAAVPIVKAALGDSLEYRRTEFVGPKVSDELFWDGVMAICVAIIAMLAYIWFRFEWQFGVCAIIALIHDVFSTIGIFSLLWLDFDLSEIAAVLTIAGYSINDTVVVFDRVRENLRKFKAMPLPELFNRSINETLARTTMTSFTTLLALLALYFLGGEVIRGFCFAMIWGVGIGTFSSICLAVPMLLYMNLPRGQAPNMSGEAAQQGPA
jgi:preprotein translocase subunit SecF